MNATLWAQQELDALERAGLRRTLEPLESVQGAHVTIGGRRLLSFSSNDYLGLAASGPLRSALVAAAERFGVGSGASRLIVGDTQAHQSLERTVAQLLGVERALLFNSGYAANVGMLAAVAGREDVIFSDALNHASLVDGCRLSRANVVVFPHQDLRALKSLMVRTPARRQWVCTDAVFSMDGDCAQLPALVELCREQGAALYVDEAHAMGVFGPRGEGLCHELGVAKDVDVRMGTLGKAFGTFGAFAACSGPLADLFIHKARSLVFSTALPPALCATSEAAVQLAVANSALRAALWRNVRRVAEGLSDLGLAAEPRSPIFSIPCGEPERAVRASAFFREQGILLKAVRPPTVPAGTSRLRLAVSAAHAPSDIERLLDVMRSFLVTSPAHVASTAHGAPCVAPPR